MEMMIVLLIMSIIAAATAPIVSKKMSKSASSSNSNPWVFIDTKGNAAFNMAGKDVTAVIGASKVPTGVNTRLYIDCGSSNSQLTFGKGDEVMQVTADPSGRAGISSDSIQPNSVAIGGNQSLSGSSTVTIGQNASTTDTGATAIGASANASGRNSVSIGSDSKASGTWSVAIGGTDVYTGAGGKVTQATGSHNVAIGTGAQTESSSTVAIGDGATATGADGIAIGTSPKASAGLSIAVGQNAQATAINSVAVGSCSDSTNYTRATKRGAVAIGYNARAIHEQSYAIGNGAKTTNSNQIVLGAPGSTVYIPGNLIVDGKAWFMGHYNSGTCSEVFINFFKPVQLCEPDGSNNYIYHNNNPWYPSNDGLSSDRRLKNIGEKYIDSLDALKKLDFYHYTYKKDEAKTPHVGVIAQDLQKVFPDAVTKGEDGFLRIRMEDMFYAVINAVKELDNKVASILEDITGMKSKIEAQSQLIKTQQAAIENLEKRLSKLEANPQ